MPRSMFALAGTGIAEFRAARMVACTIKARSPTIVWKDTGSGFSGMGIGPLCP